MAMTCVQIAMVDDQVVISAESEQGRSTLSLDPDSARMLARRILAAAQAIKPEKITRSSAEWEKSQ